jgi:putative endonuclease
MGCYHLNRRARIMALPYTVYILHSISVNIYYIRHTGDQIDQRLRRHLSDHAGFTAKAKDWTFAFLKNFNKKHLQAKEKGK